MTLFAYGIVAVSALGAMLCGLALVRHLRRRSAARHRGPQVPVPPAPKMKVVAQNDRLAAVHEAGHVVIDHCCTRVTRVLSVEIYEEGGLTRSVVVTGDVEGRWCSLVSCLGGIAAEVLTFGRTSTMGNKGDLRSAQRLAIALAKRGSLAPPWPSEPKRRTVPFATVYEDPLSDDELVIMVHAWDAALRIVRARLVEQKRLASALLDRRRLRSWDIDAIIGRRPVQVTMGLIRKQILDAVGKGVSDMPAGFVPSKDVVLLGTSNSKGGPDDHDDRDPEDLQ